jgi:hypothetical protein
VPAENSRWPKMWVGPDIILSPMGWGGLRAEGNQRAWPG